VTLDEIRKAKAELEEIIAKTLAEFETVAGIRIERVDLVRAATFGRSHDSLVGVHVEVRL
jgi:hypothetical protein